VARTALMVNRMLTDSLSNHWLRSTLASLMLQTSRYTRLALASAAAFHDLGIHFATITVNGAIKSGTPYAPEAIAERFWQAHLAPRPDWTGEILFDGA